LNLRKILQYLLQCDFINSEAVSTSQQAFKKASCIAPQMCDVSRGSKHEELVGHCFLLTIVDSSRAGIVEKHMQSPMQLAESAAPVWHQSVAVFNEILMNFNKTTVMKKALRETQTLRVIWL